jgi:hypothetical protein
MAFLQKEPKGDSLAPFSEAKLLRKWIPDFHRSRVPPPDAKSGGKLIKNVVFVVPPIC